MKPPENKPILHVGITDASSDIASYLMFLLGRGEVFGTDQPLALHLIDSIPLQSKLEAVARELEFCAFPLLKEITTSQFYHGTFQKSDVLVLLVRPTRKSGLLPKNYLYPYVDTFKKHGLALALFSKPTVHVVVFGLHSNVHATLLADYIADPRAITTVTRLAAARAEALLTTKVMEAVIGDEVLEEAVTSVEVWGNSAGNQWINAQRARVHDKDVATLLRDDIFLRVEFVQNTESDRVMYEWSPNEYPVSSARAIAEHLKELWFGTRQGTTASMGVLYALSSRTPPVFLSLPVTIFDKKYTVDETLLGDGCFTTRLNDAAAEVLKEYKTALSIIEEDKKDKKTRFL